MSSSSSKQTPPAMEWASIPVGVDKHTIRISKPPPVGASNHLKARAFDYFASQLTPLTSKFTISELVAAASEVLVGRPYDQVVVLAELTDQMSLFLVKVGLLLSLFAGVVELG